MRITVKLIQHDLLEDKKQILLETNALYDGNTLRYREENERGSHQVYFGDDYISFERKADVHTKITLFDDKDGESVVNSQYGKCTCRQGFVMRKSVMRIGVLSIS